MPNSLKISFDECEVAPANGYNIQYKVLGSEDPLIDAGNFTSSPAIVLDPDNDPGTLYEGTIRADCGEGSFGPEVAFNTSWRLRYTTSRQAPNTTATFEISVISPSGDTSGTIRWGDGSSDEPFVTSGGVVNVSHTYIELGEYNILIGVIDVTSLISIADNGNDNNCSGIEFLKSPDRHILLGLKNVQFSSESAVMNIVGPGLTIIDSPNLISFNTIPFDSIYMDYFAFYNCINLVNINCNNNTTEVASTGGNINLMNMTLESANVMVALIATDGKLTTSMINDLLIKCDSNGLTNGQVHLQNQSPAAPPDGAGAAAAANLIGKSWSITTD